MSNLRQVVYCDPYACKNAGGYVWYVFTATSRGQNKRMNDECICGKPTGQPPAEPHHWLICGMQTDDVDIPGHILIRMMWKWVGCSLGFSFSVQAHY